MNIPLLLCLLTYAPGLILNSTFLLCVKSPRTTLNAADLTIFLKTFQYILVYTYLLVAEGLIWSKEILDKSGERILSGISDVLVDTLPITAFVLALIRIMIFSNVGGSLRKVKISTVLVLYGSCFLYVFISSAIIHIPSADNQPELPAIMKNFSRKAGIDNLQYMCAHYFTIYITPCIGSVMLYSFIILKMREFASNLMAHQERLNVQTPSKVSAVRAVARPMLAYMATFLLLWVPYIFCKLHKCSNENAYVVEIIEKAITGSILILNPIADGMFQASRRSRLLKYIRNSSNQVNSTNQENSQLTSHPHMDNHTKSKENSRPFYNSEYSKQPLYARRRGSDNDTPRISIINTPTQIIMMTTPPMDNLHLSPKGSIELLSPIFYRRKEDSPSRSMSFHTVQSNDCFIESISFRSSLLSVDQGPYSSTPGSIQASSRQSNKRLSVLRCKRSTNASIGHGYVRSSVATNSIPRTSFSSHRSGGGTGSIKK